MSESKLDVEDLDGKMKLDTISDIRLARQLPNLGYEAKPKDQTIAAYLHEAFKLLELRFSLFDNDQAGVVIFSKMARDLSKYGFVEEEKLEKVFRKVDVDRSQTLDFMEFVCLMYFWQAEGDWSCFFRTDKNNGMVKMAFKAMQKFVTKYDEDHNNLLNIHELDNIFREHFAPAFASGIYTAAVDVVYPESTRQDGGGLSLRKFMMLVYHVLCDWKGSQLEGRYKHSPEMVRMPTEVGESSPFWKGMAEAFSVLEEDFNRFDTSQSKYVDIREITSGIPTTGKSQADILDVHARIQHYFLLIDVSQSGALNFFEYLYMVFLTTANGSYHELASQSRGSQAVKRAFVELHRFYNKYDSDRNFRLTWDELVKFCEQEIGEVPSGFAESFAKFKYRSSATGNSECVDLVRFLKLLYVLICPAGPFHPDRYDGEKPAAFTQLVASQPKVEHRAHPARFQIVDPAKFVSEKLLGEGGQGRVHLGVYEGVKCAGKTLLHPSEDMLKETLSEVDFFLKLDHANCHYLLGAHTSLNDGGIMLLTEVCAQGSIFDIYSAEQRRFDGATALRIAQECAQGLEHIHEMGFMHRDLKSLNVFMTEQLQAKVADFGMATDEATSSKLSGTVQWMAPEVVKIKYGKASTYDKRCDVYSYGILLWEIFHGKVPYADSGLGQATIGRKVMKSGGTYRPKISPNCPISIQGLIEQCWDEDPDKRPTLAQVLEGLDACVDECADCNITASVTSC